MNFKDSVMREELKCGRNGCFQKKMSDYVRLQPGLHGRIRLGKGLTDHRRKSGIYSDLTRCIGRQSQDGGKGGRKQENSLGCCGLSPGKDIEAKSQGEGPGGSGSRLVRLGDCQGQVVCKPERHRACQKLT